MFIYSYPFKWSEMYSYLDWELNVDSEIMTLFERTVKKKFITATGILLHVSCRDGFQVHRQDHYFDNCDTRAQLQ